MDDINYENKLNEKEKEIIQLREEMLKLKENA